MTTREQLMAEAVRRAAPADPERLTADDFARIAQEFETIREEQAAAPEPQTGGQETGLREQAKALIAAEQERTELVAEGTALLKARGEYDDGDSPEMILRLSGLTPPEPDPATDLQANLAAANSDIAAAEASD